MTTLRDVRDLRTEPDGTVIDADVCIIGSGPAGLSVASRLGDTGARVVVLESGGRTVEAATTDALRGRSIGYSYYRLERARARGLGGTSLIWPLDEGVRTRPLDPVDFDARPGIPYSGWPLQRDVLDPYWPEVNARLHLGPATWSPDDWSRPGSAPLALSADRVQTTMFQLGSHDVRSYAADVAAMPEVTLCLHGTVTELHQGDGGRIDTATVADGAGRRLSVRSRLFVLAAGGIGNARILLASTCRSPRGIGNGHDLVGRFFMEKLSMRAGHLEVASPATIARSTLYSEHSVGRHRVQGTLRLTDEVIRDERLLNSVFFLLRRPVPLASEGARSLGVLLKGRQRVPRPEATARLLRNVVADAGDIARLVSRQVPGLDDGDDVLLVRAQAEQLPNPNSRITLTGDTDDFGVPRACLDWRLTDLDRRSIRRHQEILDDALRRAGIGHIRRLAGDEDPPSLLEGNHHHIGTTRMHPDPRQGVVDADSRVHEAPNLFVAGSSVFPTSGCSNPTLTIMALAMRLGDRLRRELDPPAVVLQAPTTPSAAS